VFQPEQIEPPRQVHVLAAVGGDVVQPPFLPPAQSLQAVGALGLVQGRLPQIVQGHTVFETVLHPAQEVKARQGPQVEGREGREHRVVEAEGIEAHHQLRGPHAGKELRQGLLRIGEEIVGPAVIGHGDAHAHAVGPVPAAHLGGAAPGLHVEDQIMFRRPAHRTYTGLGTDTGLARITGSYGGDHELRPLHGRQEGCCRGPAGLPSCRRG